MLPVVVRRSEGVIQERKGKKKKKMSVVWCEGREDEDRRGREKKKKGTGRRGAAESVSHGNGWMRSIAIDSSSSSISSSTIMRSMECKE